MNILFTDGWKFKRFDLSAEPLTPEITLNSDGFLPVEIPHDWLIYNPARLYEDGEGWYKKDFLITAEELGLITTVIFDGVYMDSTVFVNNQFVGDWKYGYTAFDFNISKFLKEGKNTIAVRVRHEAPNTRWYSGAGIYRNVWINKQSSVARILNDGVYIHAWTDLSSDEWSIRVITETEGDFDEIRHTLINPEGDEVETFVFPFAKPNPSCFFTGEPHHVHSWDIENPHVYTLKTELIKNNEVVDCEENPVGFRTIEFNPEKGFFLNGRHLKMHGVCLHHDLGALGAAFNKDAACRQLKIMQDMGVNAVRISHNPPAREFLDLCDEMGILVINELTDIWELPKNKNDYARFFPEWYEKDVASWVRRDRNHPSVIMWSIGNEIHDTHNSTRGLEITKALIAEVAKHDPKKNAEPTIGSNFMPFPNAQKVADELKLAGYNYAENLYDAHREQYPDWFIYGSETASSVRSRGVYRFPAEMPILSFEDMQCSDLGNSVVGWGLTAERAWILDRDRPWCGGQFIWTGMDYIGEPTPYPAKNSYFGAVDTAGLPKAIFWFYKSVWDKKAKPFIKLFPHWDWNEGQIIDIIAYSNMEEAELFLNDRSLGRQQIDHAKGEKLRFEWKAPYEKGEILVKAYDKNGEEVATDCKKSFGEAVRVEQEVEKFGDLTFVRIYAVDKDGIPVENARNRVFIEACEGSELIGIDNGDSTDYDSYKGNNKRLFGGQLVAIVRENGSITAKIAGENPLRKIELTSDRLILNKENPKAKITVRLLPENADFHDIKWKCVLDTGAEAEIASVENNIITATGDGGTVVKAIGDGAFKVRAACNNGKEHTDIISELNFTVSGVGEAIKKAFTFVKAGQYDISYAPLKIIERGSVTGVNNVKTLIGFKNVDFGKNKTDALRLYIGTTSYFDEVIVEVYSGDLTQGNARLIDTLSFPRNNLHYDFLPHDFKLPEKLSGVQDLCFTVDRRCVFGGFEFVDTRAFEGIYAAERDEIYGDNFTVTENKIENIGNNVIIKFNALDFSVEGVSKIIISGFAPNGNSVTLKFNQNGTETSCLLEFPKSDNYIYREFIIDRIKGKQNLSFIFLPGSNFNLERFRFEQ